MSEQLWYYAVGSEQRGPVSVDALRQMLQASQLTGETLVWRDGMPDWVAAATLSEFQFAPPPPPQQAVAPQPAEPASAQAPVYTANTPQYGQVPNTPYVEYQSAPADPGGGMAVTSLVLGIVSIPMSCVWCLAVPLAILAIVFGAISKSPAYAGQAKAGIICGIIGIAMSLGFGAFGLIGHF